MVCTQPVWISDRCVPVLKGKMERAMSNCGHTGTATVTSGLQNKRIDIGSIQYNSESGMVHGLSQAKLEPELKSEFTLETPELLWQQ